MKLRRRTMIQLAIGTAVAAIGTAVPTIGAGSAQAQDNQRAADYPDRTIRVVVPYPPGGGADLIGRTIAAGLAQAWNVPVIVENKPGASGTIGNDTVAKSDPDGHTILLGITAMIQAPALYPRLPYEVKDLAPVSQIAMSSDLFVVPADSPARTLQEFVELARSKPGQFQVGNYGNGTSSHIHGELLELKTGIDLVSVAYKGAAPLVNELLASGGVDAGLNFWQWNARAKASGMTELFSVAQLVNDSHELRNALSDPARTVADKQALLTGLLDGKALPGEQILARLNRLFSQYGVGRGMYTGDTVIGLKGRIVYEAPGLVALLSAHRALEEAVLSKQQNRFKPEVARKWVELVYEGFFHDPLKTDLEAFLASSQATVNGEVVLETRGGRVDAVAVKSPHLLHSKGATYAQSADWGVEEAEGFIRLFGMSSTLWAEVNR